MKSLKDHMPYFITGNYKLSDQEVADELQFWHEIHAVRELQKVPERYHLKVGHAMSDSMGLEIFIQMITYLKILTPSGFGNINTVILAAQKQVLHYYNTQYVHSRKETFHGSNPGLPEKNSSNEGKEGDLLHGRETIT